MLNRKVLALATASTLSTAVFVETSTVKAGESLWSSAQQYDVRIDKLKNNNFELDAVFPNRQLEFLMNKQGNNIYVVQPGDNLYSISKEFGVTIDELAELNGIDAPDLIYQARRLL